MVILMRDLDEILEKTQKEKINWLVGEVYLMKHEIKTIKNNHLSHMNEDILSLKHRVYVIGALIVTFLTGQNILM
jgi:hypothetical protein|tara:strand:- start:844 stop:1068 length:225 start_codon:yes stop_codon:yes gene_type:complete